MIGKSGKCNFALERGIVAQLGRNEDTPLFIDDNFVCTADVEKLEGLDLAIEARALANLIEEAGPFVGRIGGETMASLEDEIRDIEAIMTVTIEHLAKAHREADATFVINRVIEASTEHDSPQKPPNSPPPPLTATTSHFTPHQSRSARKIGIKWLARSDCPIAKEKRKHSRVVDYLALDRVSIFETPSLT